MELRNSKIDPFSYQSTNRKVSEMLEEETKKMEDKLEMVKKMMELEKDKRNSQKKSAKDGTVWRSATTQK